MSLPIRGLRLAFTAALALPILPMCWIAGTGQFGGTGSTACAANAVTCNTCTPNTCPGLDYSQSIVYKYTTYLYRCIDYDNSPPGHCAYVMRNVFDIMYVNRNGIYFSMGTCVKEECTSQVILNDSPCDRPLQLGSGGDPGGGGGIGE
jgi:hypothetical protein